MHVFDWSYHYGRAPDVYDLTQEQSRNCLQNTRSTSSKPKNLRLGTFNSKTFKSFSSVAPVTWNSLSSEIQKSNSKSIFKHSFKKQILRTYKEKVECKNTRCTDQRYHVWLSFIFYQLTFHFNFYTFYTSYNIGTYPLPRTERTIQLSRVNIHSSCSVIIYINPIINKLRSLEAFSLYFHYIIIYCRRTPPPIFQL